MNNFALTKKNHYIQVKIPKVFTRLKWWSKFKRNAQVSCIFCITWQLLYFYLFKCIYKIYLCNKVSLFIPLRRNKTKYIFRLHQPLLHSSLMDYLAQEINGKTDPASFIAFSIWYGYQSPISGMFQNLPENTFFTGALYIKININIEGATLWKMRCLVDSETPLDILKSNRIEWDSFFPYITRTN